MGIGFFSLETKSQVFIAPPETDGIGDAIAASWLWSNLIIAFLPMHSGVLRPAAVCVLASCAISVFAGASQHWTHRDSHRDNHDAARALPAAQWYFEPKEMSRGIAPWGSGHPNRLGRTLG